MLILFSLLSVPFTIFDIAEVYFMFVCLCVFAGELGRKCKGKGCVKQLACSGKWMLIPIENLVLPNYSVKIPLILETCFKHIEAIGA